MRTRRRRPRCPGSVTGRQFRPEFGVRPELAPVQGSAAAAAAAAEESRRWSGEAALRPVDGPAHAPPW